MPRIVQKIDDPKIDTEIVSSFLGGLNTFQDESVIKDGELSKARNIILSVDGIEPRPGTEDYGTSSGSKVVGLFGMYLSGGTRQFLRYATGINNKLQKYVSGTPTDVGSATFDASARMTFVQARDTVYGFNGVDALWKYDGTTITQYSALTTPTGLGVTPTGTTGSTTSYSYRVSAFRDSTDGVGGETLACTSVSTATGTRYSYQLLTTTPWHGLSCIRSNWL
jgi:hypothetical protein